MYVISVLLFITYVIWGFLSRREQVPDGTERLLKPFYRMALYLYKKLCIGKGKVRALRAIQVRKDLEKLHPGQNPAVLMTEYTVKKVALMLTVLLIGTGIGLAVRLQAEKTRILHQGSLVGRSDYSHGEVSLNVRAEIGKKYKREFNILVNERKLTEEEAQQLQEEFWQLVVRRIRGDNESLEFVTKNLELEQEWEDYPFVVEWNSSNPERLSRTGAVAEVEKDEEISLYAEVSYEEWKWDHELVIRLCPPVRTQEEQLYRKLMKQIEDAEADSREMEQWQLPGEVEGERIIWKEQIKDNSLLFWTVVTAASIGIYFLSDKDLHDKLMERNRLMREEYPLIINKLALYLGAGMTVRGAFRKIAEHYQMNRKEGFSPHPAYEEMVYTCRELQDGVSEGAAYEHFGKRTGLQEYIRLSTLLAQNLKKGNTALLPRLREESAQMLKEQVNYRKQRGEEAGTKLLLPMMMMLGIVMVLIMIPAFSSFGI